MKSIIKIDYANRVIHYNKAFETKASDPNSKEYEQLVKCCQQFPAFRIERRTIKRNPAKESYLGLTYGYMKKYIRTHSSLVDANKILKEFEELKLISECHSKGKRYPTIKKWFLKMYPEVAKYGVEIEEIAENACGESLSDFALCGVAS